MTARTTAADATGWRQALRRAAAAVNDFLRGYTGIRNAGPLCGQTGGGEPATSSAAPGPLPAAPTPAEVRRALAEHAARRPTCC